MICDGCLLDAICVVPCNLLINKELLEIKIDCGVSATKAYANQFAEIRRHSRLFLREYNRRKQNGDL